MDNTSESSAAFHELMSFGKEYGRATLLLRAAAHDYAAARCLLFNGMFEGLTLGAQAIEKCLKAYLLLADPKRDVKSFLHSLPKLLSEADALFPQLTLRRFAPLAENFWGHYEARYPDNPSARKNKTTADIRELDEFVVFLSENMPCPRVVKYYAGIYPLITFSMHYKAELTTWEAWIKKDNRALIPLLPRINAEYAQVMKEVYPEPFVPRADDT